LTAIDEQAKAEIDQATDACVDEPLPPGDSALEGVYANAAALRPHWYRSL
jgi:TPP-dependent pyruvate/acetoin dehydrogenase alpha subunit